MTKVSKKPLTARQKFKIGDSVGDRHGNIGTVKGFYRRSLYAFKILFNGKISASYAEHWERVQHKAVEVDWQKIRKAQPEIVSIDDYFSRLDATIVNGTTSDVPGTVGRTQTKLTPLIEMPREDHLPDSFFATAAVMRNQQSLLRRLIVTVRRIFGLSVR